MAQRFWAGLTPGTLVIITLFGVFTVRAQEAAGSGPRPTGTLAFLYTNPAGLTEYQRLARQSSSKFSPDQPDGSLRLSLVVLASDHSVPGGTELAESWNAPAIQAASGPTFGPNRWVSYDPSQIFNGPDEFAVHAFALRRSPDDLLRTNGKAAPPATSVWIDPATESYDKNGGNRFEMGMAAEFVFCRQSRYPVTITLPVNMAYNDDPYYMSHHFGYVSGGVKVRVPLSFVPDRYGKWTAGTSADVCYFGSTRSEFVQSINLQMPKIGAAFSLEF
jgi:hypothetical protein